MLNTCSYLFQRVGNVALVSQKRYYYEKQKNQNRYLQSGSINMPWNTL